MSYAKWLISSKFISFQYIFGDINNKYIFTTTDYGASFTSIQVPFRPKTISIHRTKPNIVLGMDDEESRKMVGVDMMEN